MCSRHLLVFHQPHAQLAADAKDLSTSPQVLIQKLDIVNAEASSPGAIQDVDEKSSHNFQIVGGRRPE